MFFLIIVMALSSKKTIIMINFCQLSSTNLDVMFQANHVITMQTSKIRLKLSLTLIDILTIVDQSLTSNSRNSQ